uniref:Uncharacterized protein n=1 Tax=Candidatus Kentrum sp. TC TaxID=2126339 RepID=A0A450YLE1_9GAMM|nr:MAG: hypothetical protein BECKTC1821E_GA0114239_101825 [Candidatus Kentron sp. TC]
MLFWSAVTIALVLEISVHFLMSDAPSAVEQEELCCLFLIIGLKMGISEFSNVFTAVVLEMLVLLEESAVGYAEVPVHWLSASPG